MLDTLQEGLLDAFGGEFPPENELHHLDSHTSKLQVQHRVLSDNNLIYRECNY